MNVVSLDTPTGQSKSFRLEGVSDLLICQLYRYGFKPTVEAGSTQRPTYFTPTNFDESTAKTYRSSLDQILGTYEHAKQTLTTAHPGESGAIAKATQPLLPVSQLVNCIITLPKQNESLISELQVSDLEEVRALAPVLAGKEKEEGTLSSASNAQKASSTSGQELPAHSIDHAEPVRLLATSLRNELQLLPYILFENSTLSIEELGQQIDAWLIEHKIGVYQMYLQSAKTSHGQKVRAPLQRLNYTWEIMSEYVDFRGLLADFENIVWQAFTPRYGFDVPQIADDAGLLEAYEKCYELSFTLYSALSERGYTQEAQYAVLQGHRLRWQLSHSADALLDLFDQTPQNRVLGLIHARLAEVHPIFADNFSNQKSISPIQ